MTTKIKFPALHMGQVVDASENRRVPDEPEMFTEEQAREMLRAACKKAGNPSAWATSARPFPPIRVPDARRERPNRVESRARNRPEARLQVRS